MPSNLFAPDIEVGNPKDFLNASRGVDVNTQGDSSLGKLFSGIGDMVGVATKATTAIIDNEISQRVAAGVDAIRNEMGVDAATDTQEAPGKTTPAMLENGYREIARNTKAMQAGTLTDSHYWARLNSVARQLRSQFPGHRDEIDQKISSMVGSTPANALIRSLRSEAEEAGRKASSEEARFQTFFQSHITKGNVDGQMAAAVQRGVIPRDQFTIMMADRERSKELVDLELKGLNLRKQRNEAVQDDGNKLAERTIPQEMSRLMTDQTSILGQSAATLRQQINDVAGSKIAPDAETLRSLTQSFTVYEQNARALADNIRLKFAGVASPEAIEKNLKPFLDNVKAEREAIEKGDIALLSRNRMMLEATKNNSQLEVLQNEDLRRSAALRATHGDNFVLSAMTKDAPALTRQVQAVSNYLLNGAILGRSRSLADAVGEVRSAAGQPQGSTVLDRAVVSNATRLIADPKTPEDAAKNLINNFFDDTNKRYLQALPNQERPFIFSQMTSPAVEAKVLALKDPVLQGKYDSWVRHNAMVNSVGVLNKFAEYTPGDYVNISFNGSEFVANPTGKVPKNPSDFSGLTSEENNARFLVRDLNAFYKPLANIYEREGKGRDLAAYHYLNSVGLGSRYVPNALTTTKGDSGGGEDAKTTTLEPDGQAGSDDEEIKRRMLEEEKGAGVPGAPPDFTMFSEEMRLPVDVARELTGLSNEEQAAFWKEFIELRKKRFPKTPTDPAAVEDFMKSR